MNFSIKIISVFQHVVLGFFDFHASPQPPGYEQFYYAAIRTLEKGEYTGYVVDEFNRPEGDLPTTTKKSYLLGFGIQNTPVRNLVTTGLYFTKKSYFSYYCQLHTFFNFIELSTPCLAIRVHSEQIFQHEIKDQNAIVNFVPVLGPPSWLFSGALFSRETYASLLVNLYDD